MEIKQVWPCSVMNKPPSIYSNLSLNLPLEVSVNP